MQQQALLQVLAC